MSDSMDLACALRTTSRTSARPRPTFVEPFRLSSSTALTILAFSGVIGGVGDLLLHDGPTGIGFPVWIAIAAVAFVALLWRLERALTLEPALWFATAVLFAAGVSWRDSDTLEFLNGLAALFALLMAVVSVRDGSSGLLARRMRDTLTGLASAARNSVVGIVPLAFREAVAATQISNRADRSRRFARSALISGVVIVVFGALLRSADPIFASLTSLPALDGEAIASHTAIIVVLMSIVAGAARATLLPVLAPRDRSNSGESRLEQSDIAAALITLNILFGAFVLTQLGWFFGGEAFLRARTGLTAAQYARDGFFQMVLVVALVLPLLVVARAMLPRGRSTDRRFASLALPVVLLLGAMIVSAALRMRLYVSYFGLSTDRFYALAFMAWLAVALMWFCLTVVRGWGRPFAAGAVISAMGVLAVLNIAAPDEIVAGVNVSRVREVSSSPSPLDLVYLASLSGEAAPIAVRAVLAHPVAPLASAPKDLDRRDHCRAVNALLRRWRPGSDADTRSNTLVTWRTWNAGEHRAVQAIAPYYAALLKMNTICNSRT